MLQETRKRVEWKKSVGETAPLCAYLYRGVVSQGFVSIGQDKDKADSLNYFRLISV